MGSTYAVVTTVVMAAWLEWREGSCGWLQGRGHYWTPLCAACTGTGKQNQWWWTRWWWMMDAMLLRDFLLQWWDVCIQLPMVMNDVTVVFCFMISNDCVDWLWASVGPLLHSASAFFCWWWRQIIIVVIILRVFLGGLCWYRFLFTF